MSKKDNNKLIEIGYVKKPHGIRGDFSLFLFNAQDSSLGYVERIVLFPFDSKSSLPKDGQEFEIEKVKLGPKNILKLKNIDNRNPAEEIIPFKVYVYRSDLKTSSEDEVFLNDLIGYAVQSIEGKDLGHVNSFYDNGAQDIMVVKGSETLDVLMIDQFIKEIDHANKMIIIKLMEML